MNTATAAMTFHRRPRTDRYTRRSTAFVFPILDICRHHHLASVTRTTRWQRAGALPRGRSQGSTSTIGALGRTGLPPHRSPTTSPWQSRSLPHRQRPDLRGGHPGPGSARRPRPGRGRAADPAVAARSCRHQQAGRGFLGRAPAPLRSRRRRSGRSGGAPAAGPRRPSSTRCSTTSTTASPRPRPASAWPRRERAPQRHGRAWPRPGPPTPRPAPTTPPGVDQAPRRARAHREARPRRWGPVGPTSAARSTGCATASTSGSAVGGPGGPLPLPRHTY